MLKVSTLFQQAFIATVLFGCSCVLLAQTAEEVKPYNPYESLFLATSNAQLMRQIQTRRKKSIDENKLYLVCINVLQDLGFSINKSNRLLGYARGVKDRKAEAPVQELTLNILNVLAILTGNQPNFDYEEDQTINAMFVIMPVYLENTVVYDVRVTFHRYVRQPFRVKAEILENPELYKSFFSLLDKAIFLKEHQL